jgi:hypothetical protein
MGIHRHQRVRWDVFKGVKEMKRIALALLVFLAPLAVQAQEIELTEPPNNVGPNEYLKNVALNAQSEFLEFRLMNPQGWSILILYVDYTHANNGTLTLTCTSSDKPDHSAEFTLQTCDNADGTCTLKDSGVWVTASLTASKKFSFPIGILGYRELKCSIAHGGTPSASDLVTITGYMVTK